MDKYTTKKDELELLKEENARLKEELEELRVMHDCRERMLDKLIDILHVRGKSHLTIYKKPE